MTTPDPADIAREAARQQALVSALWMPDASATAALEDWCRAGPVTLARGLQAYRANAAANAARALEAAYPTVCALLGAADFEQLARELWLQKPPLHGDLAQWGESLPPFLAAHAVLADWPYLGDCARLDWAVHRCERAIDVQFDAPSIARLGDTDPQQLRFQLRPGLSVLASRWPVVSIHQAHRDGAEPGALAAARDALHAGDAESALVCRSGWRAHVRCIDAATLIWTQRLLAGDSLATALDAMADAPAAAPFDLAGWLATALSAGWLQGITIAGD